MDHVEVSWELFIVNLSVDTFFGLKLQCFILTTGQITMCNLKGVTFSYKPTETHHLTLQFPSALQRFNASQLVILVIQPTTPITLILSSRQLFSAKKPQ